MSARPDISYTILTYRCAQLQRTGDVGAGGAGVGGSAATGNVNGGSNTGSVGGDGTGGTGVDNGRHLLARGRTPVVRQVPMFPSVLLTAPWLTYVQCWASRTG